MHYYTKGEMKKTGWNNELVAQEYVDLYIFDPLHVRLRHWPRHCSYQCPVTGSRRMTHQINHQQMARNENV